MGGSQPRGSNFAAPVFTPPKGYRGGDTHSTCDTLSTWQIRQRCRCARLTRLDPVFRFALNFGRGAS